MFKILISALFIFATLAIAKDDTYVFEAKGAFAKDLKALVEKYAKDGKVKVKVYKKSDSIVSSILGESKPIQNGQALYEKRCASCHGKDGSRGAGAGSRTLKSMSADEIVESVENYKRDQHFGGSMKMLMQDVAVNIRTVDLNAIANYLKRGKTIGTKQNSIQSDTEEEQTSYLQ